MSDYSEQGAQPVEDAAVPDPPTVDEVAAEQRRREAAAGSGADGTDPDAPGSSAAHDEAALADAPEPNEPA